MSTAANSTSSPSGSFSSSSSGASTSSSSSGFSFDARNCDPKPKASPVPDKLFESLLPHFIPVGTGEAYKQIGLITHLHLDNEKLQAKVAKAKEKAAKPKPESISLQLLKLTPVALQASAIAIPFFGTIVIESIKLAGMFLIAGTALGVTHELSDGGVRVIKTITKEAGVGLKVIAFLGAGAAILKGGHTVVTEGPKIVTSVIDKVGGAGFMNGTKRLTQDIGAGFINGSKCLTEDISPIFHFTKNKISAIWNRKSQLVQQVRGQFPGARRASVQQASRMPHQ